MKLESQGWQQPLLLCATNNETLYCLKLRNSHRMSAYVYGRAHIDQVGGICVYDLHLVHDSVLSDYMNHTWTGSQLRLLDNPRVCSNFNDIIHPHSPEKGAGVIARLSMSPSPSYSLSVDGEVLGNPQDGQRLASVLRITERLVCQTSWKEDGRRKQEEGKCRSIRMRARCHVETKWNGWKKSSCVNVFCPEILVNTERPAE